MSGLVLHADAVSFAPQLKILIYSMLRSTDVGSIPMSKRSGLSRCSIFTRYVFRSLCNNIIPPTKTKKMSNTDDSEFHTSLLDRDISAALKRLGGTRVKESGPSIAEVQSSECVINSLQEN